MPFNFAEVKKNLNKAVIETFGLNATYIDNNRIKPEEIRARFHTAKIEQFGDNDDTGYAERLVAINTVVLSLTQARSMKVKRNGEIYFPDLNDLVVILDTRVPSNSVDEEVWQVTIK